MGGKSGTTTQSVQIPKEVLARYNAVNAQAQQVAGTPFQKYSTNPNDFVAAMNEQQFAGIGGINRAANMAQPSIAYAQQGFTPEGFQQGVQGYMNPYLQNAMGATTAQMQNVNQQQQNQLRGNAISAGAFGGDRAGIAQGNLINQQNLALGQTLGNMANQGYQQAAQNYMTGLGQIGQLGLQGQQAALQGAQAQLGAGTLEQQTQQAGQTALYNQFLQQQAYPFQVAQFLANIAMGTGGLSGSTTTTTQPMPFFSDRRLKKNIERIGQTDEGLPIHKFEYKGDPKGQKHIGLMADEVEQIHPEAVGTHKSGYKVVDYDRATSEGGAVTPQHAGLGFADGGDVAAGLKAINQMQANMPVTTGGVDAGLAAAAREIAPQPNIPQSVYYQPEYNVFADPKYQPDFAKTGTGSDNKTGNIFEKIADKYSSNDFQKKDGNSSWNPFSSSNNSVDPNGMVYDKSGNMTGDYDPTQGGAYAHGGRAGYQSGGGMMVPQYNPAMDPNSIENIINRHMAMYAKNEQGHHVPIGRGLTGGMGKYGRVPEANLPVSQLKRPDSPPPMPDSAFKQALGAASDTSDLFSKGKDLYKYYQDLKSKIPDLSEDEEKKARGGLVGYATDGSVKPNDPTEDIYSEQKTDSTKRDIPTKFDRTKLPDPAKPPTPTSQTGLGLGDVLSLGKFVMGLPFFNQGGRAGYDKGGPLTEEEIMKRTQYDPTFYDQRPVSLGSDRLNRRGFLPESSRRFTETDKPDVYSEGLQPFVAPRFRMGAKRAALLNEPITPNEFERTPERSAGLDLTMPEGAARAKPYSSLHNYRLAGDFSGINERNLPVMRAIAKEMGLTLGADFKNPDMPHIQYTTGGGGLLAPLQGQEFSLPEGSMSKSYSGAVPKELVEAAYRNATLDSIPVAGKGTSGSKVSEANKGSGSYLDKIADAIGFTKANAQEIKDKNRQGADSTDLLLSILSGVGTMASSNSPFLGAAVLQGIGGGAKTYAGLRGQALERGLAQQGVDISERGMDITAQAQGIQALKYLQSRFQPKYDASGTRIVKYVDLNGGEVSVEQYGKIMQDAAEKLKLSGELVPQAGLGAAAREGVSTEGGLGAAARDGASTEDGVGGAYGLREDRAPSKNAILPPEQDKMVPVQGHGVIPLSHLTNPDKIQETINQLYGQLNSVIDPKMKDSLQGAITRLEGSLTKITDLASTPQTVYNSITGKEIKIPGTEYVKILADAAQNPNGIATLPNGTRVMTGIPQYAEANQTMANEAVKQSVGYVNNWLTTRNMLTSLAGIYQRGQAGPPSENWGLINGVMKFFGAEPFDPKAGTTYDSALKTAMNLAISRTSEFATGAPAAGIDAAMIASPDPKKDPDALYKIITDTIGYGDMAFDRSQKLLKTKPEDVLKFTSDFAEDPKNDPQRYIEKARRDIPPFEGSTKAGADVTGTGRYKDGPTQVDENTIQLPKGTSYREIENKIKSTPKGTKIILPDGRETFGTKE